MQKVSSDVYEIVYCIKVYFCWDDYLVCVDDSDLVEFQTVNFHSCIRTRAGGRIENSVLDFAILQ